MRHLGWVLDVVGGAGHTETTGWPRLDRKELLVVAELCLENIQELGAVEEGDAGFAGLRGLHQPGPLCDTWKGQPWWIMP